MATHLLIVACILATASAVAAFPGYHGHVKPPLPAVTSTPELAPILTPVQAPMVTPVQAPTQVVDCSTVVYELIDCVPYMTIPSQSDKPNKGCCENLLSVMKADAECVCVALDTAPSMGFEVNYTRALSLSTACHLNVPHVDCHIDMSPAQAPTVTPVGTPAQAPTVTPVGTPAQAPTVIPVGTPAQAPTVIPVGTPAQAPTVTPVGTPAQAPMVKPVKTPAVAPTQAANCSTVVYELIDCVPYMTIPSESDKPSKGCCENLLSVMKVDAECVCVALETAPSMGFEVNYTRALSLSKACHLNVPHVNCHIDMSPSEAPSSGSPAVNPAPSQGAPSTAPPMLEMPKHAPAPAAAKVGGSSPIVEAPAAPPVQEASGSSPMSASTALVSMIVATLTYTLG